MKRKLATALTAALGVSILAVVAPTAPASADACAGTWGATVSPGLYYPLHPPQLIKTGNQITVLVYDGWRSAGWFMNGGVCTGGGAQTASGALQGYCGHSVGSGTDNVGHLIAWTEIGTLLLLTHESTGVGQMIADPTVAGNSCAHFPSTTPFAPLPATSGALTFIIDMVVHRANCNVAEQLTTTLLTIPGLSLLTSIPHVSIPLVGLVDNIHVSLPPWQYHVSGHACVWTNSL